MRLDPPDTLFSADFDQTRQDLAGFTRSRIFHDPELGLWLITGNDNVRIALTDTPLFFTAAFLRPIRPLIDAASLLAGIDVPTPLTAADSGQQVRIRALLVETFPTTDARATVQWAAMVTSRTEQLINDLADQGSTDLVAAIADCLPLLVILDIFGLTSHYLHGMPALANDLGQPVGGAPLTARWPETTHPSRDLWSWCCTTLIECAERSEPGTGLIGELLRHRAGDNTRLSLDTIAALVFYLTAAIAGVTRHALGHTLEHALADPRRWARIADDDHYLNTHVNESMQHPPALDGLQRITATDIAVDQTSIPAGTRCLLLAGNIRDPYAHTCPGRSARGPAARSQDLPSLQGRHRFLGTALARLQLRTALRTLARRRPHLQLADNHQRRRPPTTGPRIHTGLSAAGAPTRCPSGHHTHPGALP